MRSKQRNIGIDVGKDFTEVSQFVASGKKQQIITLAANDKARHKCQEKTLPTEPITVRLLRVKVKQKTYFLMTNLLETKRHTIQAFKALYHARWKI